MQPCYTVFARKGLLVGASQAAESLAYMTPGCSQASPTMSVAAAFANSPAARKAARRAAAAKRRSEKEAAASLRSSHWRGWVGRGWGEHLCDRLHVCV
jgi:hypothetical protein